MGYLLTLEAPDASGKSTQLEMLYERLSKDGHNVRKIRFPNYGSKACAPAEMYLHGELGQNADDTNAYAASMLFAVDRYVSFRTDWQAFYEQEDSIVILDRYTTSNAIHQLAKIDSDYEKRIFLDWLYDFEFNKIKLPTPDDVLFLDVPPAVSFELMAKRLEKDASHYTDIHEADEDYLVRCYEAAKFASLQKKWRNITCTMSGTMRSPEDIADEIYAYVKRRIEEH